MRVELGGKGYPRSEFALEGAGIDTSGDAPIILLLENGEIFVPADYISLGYTNYEVWCVGAAGGLGGGGTSDVEFSIAHAQVAMPSDVWDAFTGWHRENMNQLSLAYYGYVGGAGYNPDNVFSGSGLPPPVTIEQHLDYYYPGHVVEVQTFRDSFLKKNAPPGGGGGGGGMQIVSGALVDLDSNVPVSVGQAGVDGAMGQNKQAGSWYPPPPYKTLLDTYTPAYTDRTTQMAANRAYLKSWQNAFDVDGLPSFLPPAAGGDGGASSFGDICQASGGKGGLPNGTGGAGGVGGSVVAGGGAASTKDGMWDRISVAQGGGGGTVGNPGGKGAFSYADTSIYGAPGQPGIFRGSTRRFDYVTGDLLEEIPAPAYTSGYPTAGAGGSVRLPGNRKYGSRAAGYSPNGAVLVRLTKIA